MMRIAAFLLVAGLLAPDESAADPTAFDCKYERSAAANISTGLGVQTDVRDEADFTISFVASMGADVGQMIGNNGAADVLPIWGDGKVTFVEITGNGTVQTTVVYGLSQGRKASAHSRTTGGEGFEMPSQYYGFCDIKH